MTPLSVAHTELRLFVEQVERAHRLLIAGDRVHLAAQEPSHAQGWDEHRTAATGLLWETLDRVEHGLGLRLMQALYPVFVVGEVEVTELPGPGPQAHDEWWAARLGGCVNVNGAAIGNPMACGDSGHA